jgi:hypothetical protein
MQRWFGVVDRVTDQTGLVTSELVRSTIAAETPAA